MYLLYSWELPSHVRVESYFYHLTWKVEVLEQGHEAILDVTTQIWYGEYLVTKEFKTGLTLKHW